MSTWLSGVETMPSSHDGGSMTGRDAYWVWHTYEAPYQLTAKQAAQSLIRAGNEVHLTFHPISGDIVQILPANRAGRGLENHPGGVETNRQGKVCIQVEVIAYAKNPWTDDLTEDGKRGLAKLIAYAKDLGVPQVWPAGPPPAYPTGSSPRSVDVWNGPGGHFGHSQVPENTHGDPGAIDINVLFASEDDMPSPSDLWTYKIPRPNNTPVSAATSLSWANYYAYTAAKSAEAALAQVTALVAAIQKIQASGSGPVDLAAVQKAAEAGAEAAIRKVAADAATPDN